MSLFSKTAEDPLLTQVKNILANVTREQIPILKAITREMISTHNHHSDGWGTSSDNPYFIPEKLIPRIGEKEQVTPVVEILQSLASSPDKTSLDTKIFHHLNSELKSR